MVKEEERPVLPVVVPVGRRSAAQRRQFEQPALPCLNDIFSRTWFVARVVSCREELVADLMRSRGHAAMVPSIRQFRRTNHTAKSKRRVTFAEMRGYVIVGFRPDAMQPWYDLFRLSFVRGVIADQVGPMPIERAELIRFIKERGAPTVDAPDWEQYMETGREFGIGDQVTMVDGSWSNHFIRVKDIEGDSAFVVIQKLFGKRVHTKLPLVRLRKSE